MRCPARLGGGWNWTCPRRQYRTPRVYEQPVKLEGHRFRQIFVLDLGHEEPTDPADQSTPSLGPRPHHPLRPPDAHRKQPERRGALFPHGRAQFSGGLKVDFDMALLVIASGLYRLLARQMRGYAEAHARQIFRDLVDMPAQVRDDRQGGARRVPSAGAPAHRAGLRTVRAARGHPLVGRPAAATDHLHRTLNPLAIRHCREPGVEAGCSCRISDARARPVSSIPLRGNPG